MRNTAVFIVLGAFALSACGQQSKDDAIRAELEVMAHDFMSLQPIQGFAYEMSLEEAYRWQDEFVEIISPSMGRVVGYKTGGHDSGPGFAIFPPEGIRGVMQEDMFLPSGTAVKLAHTKRGFLEADFAFRVGNASINAAETDLEILAGLDAFIPFAEIPDPYYVPDTRTTNGTIVVNMASRYSFTGEPVPLQSTDEWLEKIRNMTFAVLDENDTLIEEGQIAGWYDPIAVVRWLRDHLLATGHQLEAGQLLSLGNIGIIRQLHANSPRGPAYTSNSFRLEYYGLVDGEPPSVTINIDR